MKKLLSLLLILTMVASVFTAFAGLSVSAAEATPTTDYLGSVKTAEIVLGKTKLDLINPAITSNHGMTVANFFDAVSENSKIEGNIDGKLVITWQTETATTAAYYVLYTGNDNESWGGRNPNEGWKLYGSTDNSSYTLLDEVAKGREGLEDRNNTGYAYAIDNPNAYTYYKLEIPRTGGYFQMNGIELYSDVDNTANLDTNADSLTYGRLQVPVNSGSVGVGCGFLDGNLYIADNNATYGKTLGVSRLLNASDNETVCTKTKVYVNGIEARFNKTYLGYTHCGRNGSDGYFFGFVGAGYTAGEETELTLLVGDSFYVTTKFTPDSSAVAVASSAAEYQTGLKTLSATVTFVEDHDLTVGDTLSFRLHDDHTDRTATVTAVEGKTVTLKAENFETSKSLLEFTLSNGAKFTIPVDTSANTATLTATGYVQVRENATDPTNKYDTRIIIEANTDYLAKKTSATIEMVFTLTDSTTKTATFKTAQAYKKVSANGEEYSATDNCALFGVVVTNVPNAVNKVTVSVIFSDGETDERIELGSADIENPTYIPSTDTTNATNISEGMTYSYIHGFEYPSEFGGPLGLVYVFQDDTNKHHETMQSVLANGGYVVVSIDGVLYRTRQYANGAPWFRINVESAGAVIYSGVSYEIILYVYDVNHTMLYYTDKLTHIAANSSTNASKRESLTVTLPDTVNQVSVKSDSISAENLGAWGDGPATNLFDGSMNKMGGNPSGEVTVNFSLNAATTLHYYTIYTGNDTASNSGRNPSKWTLYGKVNEEWVALSTVATTTTHTADLGATNDTPYSYAITNPQACVDYKIVFTTGSQFQLGEMKLFTDPVYGRTVMNPHMDTVFDGKNMTFYHSDGGQFKDAGDVKGISYTSLSAVYVNGVAATASSYTTEAHWIVKLAIDYDFVGGQTYEILVVLDATDKTGTYCTDADGYYFTYTYKAPVDLVAGRTQLLYHDTFSIDSNGKLKYTFRSDNQPFNDVTGADNVTVRGVSKTTLGDVYVNGTKVNASDYYTQDWYIVGATIDYTFVSGETYDILILIDATDDTKTYCNDPDGYYIEYTYTAA